MAKQRQPLKNAPARSTRRRSVRRKLEIGADVQTSYFFMLNCLLHSRIHTGIESNADVYDEDVNVYLAHLLNSHMDASQIAANSEYIAGSDAELFRMIEEAGSDRQRYSIYKTNADFLLMSIAVFDTIDKPTPNRPAIFHTPRNIYIARAASYYAHAASHATKLSCGTSRVGLTLQKLSDRFEDYVQILTYMRGRYLNLLKRYSPGELFHLDRQIDEVERGEAIELMRDAFLDTYHEWMKTHEDGLQEKLLEQAELLKELDPAFDFQLPA